MKKLIITFLLLPFLSFSQMDTTITYTGVIIIEGASKDQLFLKGRQWFNDSFKSSKDVLQIIDKESGELAGKGYMEANYHYKILGKLRPNPVDVFFKCNIWIKDGKYKYELTGFDAKAQSNTNTTYNIGILTSSTKCPEKWPMTSQKFMDGMWADLKKDVEFRAQEIILSLKNSMNNAASKSDF